MIVVKADKNIEAGMMSEVAPGLSLPLGSHSVCLRVDLAPDAYLLQVDTTPVIQGPLNVAPRMPDSGASK